MSLATLTEVLEPALRQGHAVAGLVVLGWEDARAYVDAAKDRGAPVILQAGPGCRAHTPLPVLSAMFRQLAEQAPVPVVAHLDHGASIEECREAIACGFSSVMFDGSRLPLEQNIDVTAQVVEEAHAAGLCAEGELGFVGYDQGQASACTRPGDVARFVAETGVDALAVSVGNVHLQKSKVAAIDFEALSAVEAAAPGTPLVIHGASGIPTAARLRMARDTAVCKLNIGTELRMCFGEALRRAVNRDAARYDRVALLEETEAPVRELAGRLIGELFAPGGG